MVTRRTVNVIMLSVGFMLLFTPFQTISNILKTILTSVKSDVPNYTADASVSLAIVYVVLALSNFLAPSIISIFGARLSMVFGALTYSLYIASFLAPLGWVLYVVSAIMGFGAAVIWTGQGTYLTENSDNLTIARNAGIFWATFQCSQLIGNLFVFFVFQGKTHIDLQTRTLVYTVLTALSILGILFLVLLRPSVTSEGQEVPHFNAGPLKAIKTAFSLLYDGRMLLLFFSFWFTGALLTFAGSFYSNAIGFTKKIAPDPKPLVGLSGVLFGLGEVVGGSVFGSLGTKTVIWGRNPIIVAGCLVLLGCFGAIYANIPNSAFNIDTSETSMINPPMAWLALLCSFLLGFGDSCFNTQLYSIIGTLFREDSAPPFAVFKVIQSISTGLGFIYSAFLGLHGYLVCLSIMLILATISFIFIERIAAKMHAASTQPEEEIVANTHQD